MKIKVKLYLGLGLLFAMILLITIFSGLYINKLRNETRNILVANYNTLDYARKMEIALNNNILLAENSQLFRTNLSLQQKNVTEPGEKEMTDRLEVNFQKLQQQPNDSTALHMVRKDITDIMLLNMLAIERKSKLAENTSETAIFWITVLGTICFIIALTLLFNLPGNIANPVKALTESIKEIANRNYSERIHFEKQNEFGELAASFNTMAEKLEEYQASSIEKLLVEKKRIDTLINNLNDPVIGLDENRKILFMNNIALHITGLKKENTIGKPVQDIAVKNDLLRTLVQELFGNESEHENKTAAIKIFANNKESYFEKHIIPISIIPTGEKDEKRMGDVILLQDVTPYKELDFAKTNFIATVSHELKTPIASIKMSLQLLENKKTGSLNSEQELLLQSINDDAGRLLKITGELLNMAQVETGSIQMAILPSSVNEMVDYAVNANKTAAENKQIKLETRIPGTIPPVLADKDKTAWVLTNLISNAIRYSYDGAAVKIHVSLEGNNVKFSVADSGQGIAPEYIHKVFDRYFRIPGSKKEGTGLGLSISKEFIEAQYGQITVNSEFGKGSTFEITLPSVVDEKEEA
ncbi:PAS/PAC sensor signal transduction histidine kinase [Lacibacter cauensis]|uniref:histidine kinase n=1 Tax=Lacibacter cauensis TaxID=510947 RepID=A0A562SJH0_9BACT|nr:ATP-binding protein [Lacibacter cauensis]TWI81308.1 PAS/PAC sensor signal transduction histidine kinase [Lacibacter cauensis]